MMQIHKAIRNAFHESGMHDQQIGLFLENAIEKFNDGPYEAIRLKDHTRPAGSVLGLPHKVDREPSPRHALLNFIGNRLFNGALEVNNDLRDTIGQGVEANPDEAAAKPSRMR